MSSTFLSKFFNSPSPSKREEVKETPTTADHKNDTTPNVGQQSTPTTSDNNSTDPKHSTSSSASTTSGSDKKEMVKMSSVYNIIYRSNEDLAAQFDPKKVLKVQRLWRVRRAKLMLINLRKRSIQRKNIANEILNTERSYVENLSSLVEVIIQPLLQNQMLSQDMAHSIFSNLDYKIIKIHIILLQALEKRMEGWHIHQPLGDIFCDFADEFKSYHHYIMNYNDSIELLAKTRQANPTLDSFLKEAKLNARCKNLGASDFLIMPIQRLPRYELLLSDLLKNTEGGTKDYDLVKDALNQVKATVNFINELKRERDSLARIKVVESKVIGTSKPASLVKEGRILVREGNLLQINMSTGKETKVYVFLFNDMIMSSKTASVRKNIIDRTLRYDHQKDIPLDTCTLEDVVVSPDEKGILNELCFKLNIRNITGKPTIALLKASNWYEKQAWLTDIKNTIEAFKKKEESQPHVQ